MYMLPNRWKSWVGCCVCVLALVLVLPGCDVETVFVGEAVAGEKVEGDGSWREGADGDEESVGFRTAVKRAIQKGDYAENSILGRWVRAQTETAEIDIRRLTEMVNTYYIRNGELPEGLEALISGSARLLEEVPEDPWGSEYVYEVLGERDFKIFSKGPDGEAETERDVTVE